MVMKSHRSALEEFIKKNMKKIIEAAEERDRLLGFNSTKYTYLPLLSAKFCRSDLNSIINKEKENYIKDWICKTTTT